MIPVKWYIAIMVAAGLCMLLYGAANGAVVGILCSFLFFGIGGLAYYVSSPKMGGSKTANQAATALKRNTAAHDSEEFPKTSASAESIVQQQLPIAEAPPATSPPTSEVAAAAAPSGSHPSPLDLGGRATPPEAGYMYAGARLIKLLTEAFSLRLWVDNQLIFTDSERSAIDQYNQIFDEGSRAHARREGGEYIEY